MPPRKTLTATRVTEEVTITEHAPGPLLPAAEWARLTAPLEHYRVPVVLTPAERAEDDAYRDALRAAAAADRDDVRQWHAQACVAVFGPLDDWLHHAPLPAMTP